MCAVSGQDNHTIAFASLDVSDEPAAGWRTGGGEEKKKKILFYLGLIYCRESSAYCPEYLEKWLSIKFELPLGEKVILGALSLTDNCL